MIDISKIDYSELDLPQVLMFLFYPRPESGPSRASNQAVDLMIPVEEDVHVGARFHPAGRDCPNILFFHGNGEIVADYDEMAGLFNSLEINFLAVDYRGYGRSTGRPTVTGMMRDAHVAYQFTRDWLEQEGYTGPFILMGRSLGSASVLELAYHYAAQIDGLIVESGFAHAGPLLMLIGVNPEAIGGKKDAFSNVEKIKAFDRPTLIIHAEYDHIIPFSDGQALHQAGGAADKTLLMIPGANHNDIHFRGLQEYMGAVRTLAEKTKNRPA